MIKSLRLRLMPVLVLVALLVLPSAGAEEWLGIYIKGDKIGWSQTSTFKEESGTRMETTSVMKAEMLGASLDMKLQSLSRFDKNGRLNHLRFEMDSGGRRLEVTADFLETEIHAEAVAGGAPTKKVIPIPEGALIVEDPTTHLPVDGIGKERLEFYIFDPNSLSLLKASAVRKPDEELEVEGDKISARVIEINDPRAKMNVYLTMDGVFVKATGPLGMVLLPESREEAMRLPKGPIQTDIATASSIVPDKPIRRISRKKSLKLKVSGIDLAHLPSGTHQTIEKQGSDWLLTLHPTEPSKLESELVSEIKPSKWTKPDFRVPSDSKEFKELAQKLIKPDDEVLKAAEKVRKEVLEMLRVNAGIGVMRDAAEILETKEGVCRDHAVVMAAILRAGNVPTRLVSGLVYQGDRFYYHAWVEVLSGETWYGLDSTRSSSSLTVGHIKTAQGTVADAFSHFLLDGARIEVLDERE